MSIRRIAEIEPCIPPATIGIRERFGLCPVAWCKVCKAELAVDYSTPGMKARLLAFCDVHEACQPTTKTCMFVVDFDCESEQSLFCNAPATNRYMPGDLWMCDEHRERLAGAYSDTLGAWERVNE